MPLRLLGAVAIRAMTVAVPGANRNEIGFPHGGMRFAVHGGMTDAPSAAALNQLTETIIGAAIRIHRALGPGLLESAYVACLAYELKEAGLHFESQQAVPLVYGNLSLPCAYRADLLVERCVLLEVKALDAISPLHVRQLRTYLRLADCRVGLLLNFGALTMREGITREVNRFPGP